jgi:hypothetical protein
MEGPLGEFYVRYPDRCELHTNKPGAPLFVVGCHAHQTAHVRFLFANDTPGSDGRLGWLEETWNVGSSLDNPPDETRIVRGNGPDSPRNIPAGVQHKFTLLSMQGYHLCFHFNWEEDENGLRRVPYYTGHIAPTR